MMKRICLLLIFFMTFSFVGCSSSPATPEDQLKEVASMLAKDFEISDQQRQDINASVAKATGLIKTGKKEEAQKILAKALEKLEMLEESDRFNKSE